MVYFTEASTLFSDFSFIELMRKGHRINAKKVYLLIYQGFIFASMSLIHKKLLELRKSKRISQQEVAEYLGIDTTSYGRIERGNRKLNTERLTKLAKFYGISVYELVREEDEVSIAAEVESQQSKNADPLLAHLQSENNFLRSQLQIKEEQITLLLKALGKA